MFTQGLSSYQFTSAKKITFVLLGLTLLCLRPSGAAGELEGVQPSKKIVLDAYHLCGFGQTKPNSRGLLSISRNRLIFDSSKRSEIILPASITAFDIDSESRASLASKTMRPIQASPYLSSLVADVAPRLADDVVTLDYRDERGGLHEAVVLVPKNIGHGFASYLSNMQVPEIVPSASPAPIEEPAGNSKAKSKKPCEDCAHYTGIRLGRVEIAAEGIPASVRALLYEDLVSQLQSSGYFVEVLRSGEQPSNSAGSLAQIQISVQSFTRGKSLARQVAPIGGRTQLLAGVQITSPSGRVVFGRTLTAALSGHGDDLEVCELMSKKIVKLFDR